MKKTFQIYLLSAFLFSSSFITANPFHIDSLKNGRGFFAYSPGTYAPIGFMIGKCTKKGHGIYGAARFNFQIFKKAQYHFEDGAVDDHNLNWYYTGEKKYSRWEAAAGAMINIFTIKDFYHFKLFGGAGVEKSRYLYSFSNTFKLGNTSSWVEFKEIGGWIFNPEAGLLFSTDEDLNFHIGVSALHKKHERMVFFGIGVGLN